MAIGRWKSVCINVTDLDEAFDFWTEVLGWTTSRKNWHGWLGYIVDPESDNYMILNDTTTAPVELTPPSHTEANRAHIDIWPNNGMDNAIADIIAIGGTLKKPPGLYPRQRHRRDPVQGEPGVEGAPVVVAGACPAIGKAHPRRRRLHPIAEVGRIQVTRPDRDPDSRTSRIQKEHLGESADEVAAVLVRLQRLEARPDLETV